jgi:hypothetical protein
MGAALPVLGAVPHAFLGRVIIGDGECFELLELKGASAIILNEAGATLASLSRWRTKTGQLRKRKFTYAKKAIRGFCA